MSLNAGRLLGLQGPESKRPKPADRRFTSEAVEDTIRQTQAQIADKELAWLFGNCFPNTLDTTVTYRETNGKPDTFVITGDIDAMWLRDSSAQVWPYLPLARRDDKLRKLLEGVIRRQARCILLDPYANAFYDDPTRKSEWASDFTQMKPGVHEHKWEVDSLCYCVRLAHGYWKATNDTAPFDEEWEAAADAIVRTFHEQQRKDGHGPYYFKRDGEKPTMDSPEIYGSPVKPVGLICSRFRPSDDPTHYQFLIPSNYFAVTSLRQLADMLNKVRHNPEKAAKARALADEVQAALDRHARYLLPTAETIYPYEIDGLGNVSVMDDANVPNLLSFPYLDICKPTDPTYQATRKFVWSKRNPQFFEGKYGAIGGHVGPDMVWPMSFIIHGMTSTSEQEVADDLRTLVKTHAGTGFMHEAFHKDDPTKFTRTWFAWANTLFGEFVLHVRDRYPDLLKQTF